ncbi:MAG: hypothetical protein KF760_29710 [Candidatus Eremiobacteraeota bacterium]|nr:hypothetical protein [Candidatus Eremiobacteraeota bacterium]MCW5870579.1 hypothetical protein [Candidatus Eremiobacteraeota bacterium]
MDNEEQLKIAVARFTGAFELIFHEDWDYTLGQLQDSLERHVAGGTFLRPGTDSRIINWGAVLCLYEAYEELRAAMRMNALDPDVPEPDDWYNYDWPQDGSGTERLS